MFTRHSISERLRTYSLFQPGSVKFSLLCKYSCVPSIMKKARKIMKTSNIAALQTLFKKSKESTDVSSILGVESSSSRIQAKRKNADGAGGNEEDEGEEMVSFNFAKKGTTASPASKVASPTKKFKAESNGNNSNSGSPRKVCDLNIEKCDVM